MRKVLCSLLLTVAMTGAAHAAGEQAPAAAATPPAIVNDNPHIKDMNAQAKELADSLTEGEATYFAEVRENFGILRSIEVAQKSVGEAVGLCAEKNSDLKKEITARHQKWDGAITEALGKQEAHMDKAVTKEHFKDPEKVQKYLDTIDKAAHYADESIEKKIVTTPEACKNLMNSMDETEKTILTLVNDMSWPEGKAGDAAN